MIGMQVGDTMLCTNEMPKLEDTPGVMNKTQTVCVSCSNILVSDSYLYAFVCLSLAANKLIPDSDTFTTVSTTL